MIDWRVDGQVHVADVLAERISRLPAHLVKS